VLSVHVRCYEKGEGSLCRRNIAVASVWNPIGFHEHNDDRNYNACITSHKAARLLNSDTSNKSAAASTGATNSNLLRQFLTKQPYSTSIWEQIRSLQDAAHDYRLSIPTNTVVAQPAITYHCWTLSFPFLSFPFLSFPFLSFPFNLLHLLKYTPQWFLLIFSVTIKKWRHAADICKKCGEVWYSAQKVKQRLKSALTGFLRHRDLCSLLYPRPWNFLSSPLEALCINQTHSALC
jgi:hypothetical protein